MLCILVVLEDIDVGTDMTFERDVNDFANSCCARSTNCAYETSVDAYTVDQTNSDLDGSSTGSFLSVGSWDFVFVCF